MPVFTLDVLTWLMRFSCSGLTSTATLMFHSDCMAIWREGVASPLPTAGLLSPCPLPSPRHRQTLVEVTAQAGCPLSRGAREKEAFPQHQGLRFDLPKGTPRGPEGEPAGAPQGRTGGQAGWPGAAGEGQGWPRPLTGR